MSTDGTLNDQLIVALKEHSSSSVQVMDTTIVPLLERYQDVVQAEVDGAKGQRNLVIHNTTREIYEGQLTTIDRLLEAIEDDNQLTIRSCINELVEALADGESVG